MAKYKVSSPWYTTPISNKELGLFDIRSVPAEPDDAQFAITPFYNLRPDLLSFDLYGTTKLWWVFTQRNMDMIRDPVFDFTTGTVIYIPKKAKLFKLLGL